jgi:hypothetical protein
LEMTLLTLMPLITLCLLMVLHKCFKNTHFRGMESKCRLNIRLLMNIYQCFLNKHNILFIKVTSSLISKKYLVRRTIIHVGEVCVLITGLATILHVQSSSSRFVTC